MQEVLRGMEHEEVRDDLKSILDAYLTRTMKGKYVSLIATEEEIEIPYVRRKRFADVLVKFSNSPEIPGWPSNHSLRGCAFEVKTRDEERSIGAGQLIDYSRAGYQPILVVPGWLLQQDKGKSPNFEWFVEFIDHCCALEIVSDDPIRVKKCAIQHNQLALPRLREYLMQT